MLQFQYFRIALPTFCFSRSHPRAYSGDLMHKILWIDSLRLKVNHPKVNHPILKMCQGLRGWWLEIWPLECDSALHCSYNFLILMHLFNSYYVSYAGLAINIQTKDKVQIALPSMEVIFLPAANQTAILHFPESLLHHRRYWAALFPEGTRFSTNWLGK